VDLGALLAQPHLTVVSGEPDGELRRIEQLISHRATVDGRADLEALLGELLDAAGSRPVACKTLDLIGHTRADDCLVTLGQWVIDIANATVSAFFRGLADHDVLPRLGVTALRLLGCHSAETDRGRATLLGLRDLLGLEVYGARQVLYAAHYGPQGFRDCWDFLLVGASELAPDAGEHDATPAGDPYPRMLDIDALPAVVLRERDVPGQRGALIVASAVAAREILRLIRRAEGARMPGLLTAPLHELALPAAAPGSYHVAHVLLDGEFLRFYPDGMAATGVVYPVDDAAELRRVVAGLSPAAALTD
jgi:hypothetical protein